MGWIRYSISQQRRIDCYWLFEKIIICFQRSRHFQSWMNYGMGRGSSGVWDFQMFWKFQLNMSRIFGRWNTVSDFSLLPIRQPDSVMIYDPLGLCGIVNRLEIKKSLSLLVSMLSKPDDRSFYMYFIEFLRSFN